MIQHFTRKSICVAFTIFIFSSANPLMTWVENHLLEYLNLMELSLVLFVTRVLFLLRHVIMSAESHKLSIFQAQCTEQSVFFC